MLQNLERDHLMTTRRRLPIGHLTRQQYESRLSQGWRFTGATLYERDHAPANTRFFLVKLAPQMTRYVRGTPPATTA